MMEHCCSGLMRAASLPITPDLAAQLAAWLAEDIGRGDLTAPALAGRSGRAHWIAKAAGVFCGGVLVEPLFRQLDPAVGVRLLVADGEAVQPGQCLLELEGAAAALVAGERTALNLAMRLSGIATATAALVAELAGTGVRLADTRKTTPGLRVLEKYAVRCGGGCNHRFGLDDAAMLKENHLAWAGGVAQAIAAVRAGAPWPARVIVEAETAAEAEAAVRAGADGVLLDEFSPEALVALVPRLRSLAPEGLVLEASGVRPDQLQAYAAAGIDLISTSAPVTRSAWLDLSMRFQPSWI
jgi:nicotinate-nucleotide pyrophosphorylase (carboxylating)